MNPSVVMGTNLIMQNIMDTTKRPIFIIGAQRSGTTLLRLILNAHSQIAIPEEGTFWMPLIRALRHDYNKPIRGKLLGNYIEYLRKNVQLKTWMLDVNHILDKFLSDKGVVLPVMMESLYLEYARANNKIIWGDKTPSFFRKVKELSQLFPAAKFIHIIRDGRDIYLSMRDRIRGRKNIAVAAMEWKYKIQKVRNSLSLLSPESWYEVRYEDILKEPEQEIKAICDFLRLNYERSMLDFWKSSHKYIGSHHSDLIFKPISSISADKWKKHLDNKKNAVFEYIAGDLLDKLGYEVIYKEGVGAFCQMKASCMLYMGLPARMIQVFSTAVILQASSLLGLKTTAAGGQEL